MAKVDEYRSAARNPEAPDIVTLVADDIDDLQEQVDRLVAQNALLAQALSFTMVTVGVLREAQFGEDEPVEDSVRWSQKFADLHDQFTTHAYVGEVIDFVRFAMGIA